MTRCLRLALITTIVLIATFTAKSQNVAINNSGATADASSILDVTSTTKGMLVPRMDKAQKNAIPTPANALLVYQTGPDSVGFHYYDAPATSWKWLSNNSPLMDTINWKTHGNVGTSSGTHFIGTTDNQDLIFKRNNVRAGLLNASNTSWGVNALTSNTTGYSNTANGLDALLSNTIGVFNTANGESALRSNTTGVNNTASGVSSLRSNTTGFENTAYGFNTLRLNLRGFHNTAIGAYSIYSDTTGSGNTALGTRTMQEHRVGNFNTAVGYQALQNDSAGIENSAIGFAALFNNKTGAGNTALGSRAMQEHRVGNLNTAVGYGAMQNDSAGSLNTAMGYFALRNNKIGVENTALGVGALEADSTGSFNTAVGRFALFSNKRFSNKTAVGYRALQQDISNGVNTALGTQSLLQNTTGINNTAVGYNSGLNNNTTQNTYIGAFAGQGSAIVNTGGGNTAVGYVALQNIRNGGQNTAIGEYALNSDTSGSRNAVVGAGSFENHLSGDENVAMGFWAGRLDTTGVRNVLIGNEAGYNTQGSFNVFLGNQAGRNATGSNKLFIQNSDADSVNALIYGEFDNKILSLGGIGGKVGIGMRPAGFPLEIKGMSSGSNSDLIKLYNSTGAAKWHINLIDSSLNFAETGVADNRLILQPGGNVGINASPAVSAALDVTSNDKGVLIPRLNTTNMNAIAAPANSLLVYNTDSAAFAYHNGTAWVYLKGNTTASNDWGILGNAGTNPATHFIGTTDAVPLKFKIKNLNAGILDSLTQNTGFGFRSLDSASGTTPSQFNTAYGYKTLMNNTTGVGNTAIGGNALRENKKGNLNTAIGVQALASDTASNNNTAVGYQALALHKRGDNNTATGFLALVSDSVGFNNTANGYSALYANKSGVNNTAFGYEAGFSTQGNNNVFLGNQAGRNATGSNKLFIQNSAADSANALIYGEFNNKILSLGGNGGKVGVGISAPVEILDVAGNAAGTNSLQLRSGNNDGSFTSNQTLFSWNGTAEYRHAIKTRHNLVAQNNNSIDFFLWNQGVDATTTIGTKAAMTIDGKHKGMVGIGTTTPNSELHISDGSASLKNVTDGAGFGASMLITDNVIPRIYFEAAGEPANKKLMDLHLEGQSLRFSSLIDDGSAGDKSDILVINRDGNVGISRVPTNGSSVGTLQLQSPNAIDDVLGLYNSTATNRWTYWTGGTDLQMYNNGTLRGTWDATNGVYTSSSDLRLKKDITELPVGALTKVNQLKTYSFRYKDNKATDPLTIGFMAQDVQPLFPEAVSEIANKDGSTSLGVKYQYFGVYAIKAIQEQQKIIETLEEKLVKLEAQMKLLLEKK